MIVTVTLMTPFGLPVPIQERTRKGYMFVESLPKGSIILFSLDYSSGGAPDITPSLSSILVHLMRRDMKVVFIGLGFPEAGIWCQTAIDIGKSAGAITQAKKYGVDYVNLGYIPGGEIAVTSLATDFKRVVKADLYGAKSETLPLLQGINGAKDIALVINFESSGTWEYYYRHWVIAQGTPLMVFSTMAIMNSVMPYYSAGKIVSVMGGLRGYAEYESQVGSFGYATKSMDMLSISAVTLVCLMVIGNMYEIGRKMKAKRGMN